MREREVEPALPARQAAPKTALPWPKKGGGRCRVDERSRGLSRAWLWHNDDAAAAGDALTASGQSEDMAMCGGGRGVG